MGKGARLACVFTPMALTVAAFLCLFLTGIGGFLNERHGTDGAYDDDGPMTGLWFFEADFGNITYDQAPSSQANLTEALKNAQSSLDKLYKVYLWDYCKSNDGQHYFCSPRYTEGYFDPVDVWNLDVSGKNGTYTKRAPESNTTESLASNTSIDAHDKAQEELGAAAAHAIEAYRKAGHWLSFVYGFAIWTALATVFCGFFALFSRWGSFFTWILSLVSSCFVFAAALTSTVLFSALITALRQVLSPYGITFTTGKTAMGVTWLAVVFSWAATLFWLFSTCCCSGRSNPHHRSNTGGTLWTIEHNGGYEQSRSGRALRSFNPRKGPYLHVQEQQGLGIYGHSAEHVPLQEFSGRPVARSMSRGVPSPFEPVRSRRQSF